MNRRSFIHAWIRTGILGGLAVMSGFFAIKGKIGKEGECISDFQCRYCRKLKSCKLPESKKERNNGEK